MTARFDARGTAPGWVRSVTAVVLLSLVAVGCQAEPSPSPSTGPASSPAAVAPPASQLIVNLARPGGGRVVHVGYPVELSAAALGLTGIAELELWADGQRIEAEATTDPSRPAASTRWRWTPTAAGDVVLVARAFDAAGQGGQSAPLRLTAVSEPPVQYTLTQVTAAGGETLEQVVATHGGDVSVAPYWNAEVPAGPLPSGTVVTVPLKDAMPPPATARAAGTVDLGQLRPVADVTPVIPTGLATPNLNLQVKDCTVTAEATGGTSGTGGFAFSVLPPVSGGFLPLPPVSPSNGGATTSFAALGGVNYVTVSAYSPAASTPSAIVPITVPPDCSANGWSGEVRLDGGKLISPSGADRAYLYLKVGGGTWQRVPAGAGTFIEQAGGALDFGAVLPPLGAGTVKLEAWGWSAGKLVRLGAGSYSPPGQMLYSGAGGFGSATFDLVGFGTSLDIQLQKAAGEFDEVLTKSSSVDRPGPNSTSTIKTFRWSTSIPGVTHLQWQILPYPLKDSTTATPPFLIDTDTIDVTGLTTGTFTIDLKPYLTGQTAGVQSATLWGQNQLVGKLKLASPYFPGATPAPQNYTVNPNGIWFPNATAGTGVVQGGPAIAPASLDDLALLMPPITALYVRVIPYVGTVPAGDASNTVSFKIVEPDDPFYIDTSPPPPPPSYQGAYTYAAKFYAPTGSDPAYYNCVIVVKGGSVNPYPGWFGDWSNGTTHCKPKDDGGWSLLDAFESFVEWVGSAWDYISSAYDWIQNKVVDAVLLFVPCEQVASQVADDGKEVCRKIAKTGLHAVMIAFGIPPEIPSWEATISAAKGDLREFILENAKDYPGVEAACTAADVTHAAKSSFPTCDKIVDKAIDEAVSRIASERSSAAASNAGVAVPPGVTVEPHPRSTPQPPHFDITVTRTTEPLPSDVVCTITAKMGSTLAGWSWLEYTWNDGQESVVQKSGTVTGDPFLAVKQEIAPLAPGQSTTYQLWLTKQNIWFEPDGWDDHYAKQYAEWHGQFNHAYVLLQQGATVKSQLSGNCTTPGSSSQVLTGKAYE
jgi:cytoskeletal protein RodZ